MIMKSNLVHRAISILITSFFCLVLVLAADNAFAFRPLPKVATIHKIPYRGTVTYLFHQESPIVRVRYVKYYYHNGIFYKRGTARLVVIKKTAFVAQSSPNVVTIVSVSVSTADVYSGPGINFLVNCQLHHGDVLTIYANVKDWLYVQLPDGQFGWVMKIYTTQLPPQASG